MSGSPEAAVAAQGRQEEQSAAAGAGGEADAQPESALRDNIKRKGANSYYYAHAPLPGSHPVGKCYDEPPRLLESKAGVGGSAPTTRIHTIKQYSWADCGKWVKLYINFEGADALPDGAITVTHGEQEASLRVQRQVDGAGLEEHRLTLFNLSHSITEAKAVGKPTRIIFKLRKEDEIEWHDLKQKA